MEKRWRSSRWAARFGDTRPGGPHSQGIVRIDHNPRPAPKGVICARWVLPPALPGARAAALYDMKAAARELSANGVVSYEVLGGANVMTMVCWST